MLATWLARVRSPCPISYLKETSRQACLETADLPGLPGRLISEQRELAPRLRSAGGGAISTVPASASRRHQRHERLATTLPKQQPRRLEPPPDLGPFWVPFSPCPGSGDGTLGLPRTGIGRGSTGAAGEHGGHGGARGPRERGRRKLTCDGRSVKWSMRVHENTFLRLFKGNMLMAVANIMACSLESNTVIYCDAAMF